ncbi:MAG: DNA ligase D [uncultured bacterium (gcode 4)]|uniref:DNA ligase (ATP) n=1 Tax=uncultured bacterium (gcode 4) TaxID=1234023 RepID=K2FGN5_9BACT|nr:MAG: DNA ligase D [uncultured bacterium (gcode 4)]
MLETYKEKRDFSKTKEPSWNKKKEGDELVFVVHKHAATRLHYDLRLELDWVLKSWAVPKWPSYNPADKHLAVMVEDHPYDYKDFEWTIPKWEYWWWTVMIWDYWTYVPIYSTWDKEKDEKAGLEMIEKWQFSFILKWKKLKWEFSLIKLAKAKWNEWILLKKKDDKANSIINNDDESAYSWRSMKEIELWIECVDNEDFTEELSKKKLKKSIMLTEVRPMLAKLVDKPFNMEWWLFEIKWDWYRTIAEIGWWKAKLYSRNLKSYDKKFSEIAETLKIIPHEAVLDWEVVAFWEDGKPNFWLLQNYENDKEWTLIFYVFDILYLDWFDLSELELSERKRILKKIISWMENIRYTDHVEHDWKDLFDVIVSNWLEWIIWKKMDSKYRQWERNDNWVKIKNIQTQEAIVCGFTEPRWNRPGIWSLILGIYDKWELTYIWHSGWWFYDKMLRLIKDRLEKTKTSDCPFKKKPVTNEKPTWVEPVIVCEIKFSDWTKDWLLRQPVFLWFREDKKATEVIREIPEKEEKVVGKELSETKSKVAFSNLDKIYFPEKNLKKWDIIDYYKKISSYILPYLKDRPESLKRYPNWINWESFFQKNFNEWFLPNWIETAKVHSEWEEKIMNYMMVQDLDSLLYAVNLWCIDINPWSSRVWSISNPDYVILDFDPIEISFLEIVKAVIETHHLLEMLWIASFCKTSGSKWMHILIPTRAQYSYDQVTDFAKIINIYINRKLPETTSLERMPKNRSGKVYLDYLQNRKWQTIASVYSIRARKEATISTPLFWSEINPSISPLDYRIDNIFERLTKKWDPWEWFFDVSFDMWIALDRLNALFAEL